MSGTDETQKARPKARSFYLVCSAPDRATVRVSLDEGSEIAFGRSDAGDVGVVVDDARVSRRHALVGRSTAGVYVRDLGSRNGTMVAGEALHEGERRVGPGDVLEVGPMTIVVAAETSKLVVADPAMRKLHAALQRVARRKAPVLLVGEPGVGKALLAEQIHDASARSDRPYVRFDCRAAPSAQAETELFGGAGSVRSLVEVAHRGTLFLAAVGELAASAQDRLFQFLETGSLAREGDRGAGDDRGRGTLDVRLVCSSSSDLHAQATSGRFHPKLYALIATLSLSVPPLRERKVEIPVLAEHLLRRVAESLGTPSPAITPEAAALLVDYAWPRNVSDLSDVLEVALALSEDGAITPRELPAAFGGGRAHVSPPVGQKVCLAIVRAGESFHLGSSAPVSLARRGPLRRVLLRLAQHRDAPGDAASVSADDLFSAGWPGERPVGQSAEGRLRTAIWTLRRMGLEGLLVTRDDGYLLAPELEIDWRD